MDLNSNFEVSNRPQTQKRFFGYSLALHGLLLLSVMTFAVSQRIEPKIETISFEILGDGAAPSSVAIELPQQAAEAAPTAQSEPAAELAVAQASLKAEVVKSTQVVKPVAAETKVALAPARQIKAAAPKIQVSSAPESLDDISTPDLEDAQIEQASAQSLQERQAIQDKLSAAVTNDDSDIERAQKEMDDQLASAQQQQEEIAKEVEKKNQQEAARLAAERKKRREEEKQMQAALAMQEKLAAEQAESQRQADMNAAILAREQAEAQAKAQADKEAAAAAMARQEAAAKAAALAAQQAAEEKAQAAARGAGGDGSSEGGLPSEGQVRQLEDLRQMPGNIKPKYDVEDRVANRKGDVVLWAYISKDGSTSQFKLIQSSGHRNLDRKTLAALKQWKFYPGQEGWVELPFKWDLEGGVQEKPTLLRRR